MLGLQSRIPRLTKSKKQARKQRKADQIVLLSLALDSKEQLQEYLNKMPLNFFHMADAGEITQGTFGALGFPTNLIIDQNGIIRHIKLGGSPQSADDIEYEMLQLLKK